MWRSVGPLVVLFLVACSTSEPTASLPTSEPAADEASPPAAETAGPHIRFVRAEPGAVAPAVERFMADARAESRVPLVYVGATWCEPCQYFHRAAEAGALDDALPRMALLEFDRDHDAERLESGGYGSRMIPLFVAPDADGRGTDQRIEGSIHGPGSPQEIAPRLRAILPIGALPR